MTRDRANSVDGLSQVFGLRGREEMRTLWGCMNGVLALSLILQR